MADIYSKVKFSKNPTSVNLVNVLLEVTPGLFNTYQFAKVPCEVDAKKIMHLALKSTKEVADKLIKKFPQTKEQEIEFFSMLFAREYLV